MEIMEFKDYPDLTTPCSAANLIQMQNNVKNEFTKYHYLETATAINSGGDLDNYKTAGTYCCYDATIAETLSNTPITSNTFKLIVEYIHSSERIKQTIYTNSADCEVYTRYYNGEWGAWLIGNERTFRTVTALDSYLKEGTYMINSAPPDSPHSGAQSGMLIVFTAPFTSRAILYITQFYVCTDGTSTYCYARTGNSTKFNSWKQLG